MQKPNRKLLIFDKHISQDTLRHGFWTMLDQALVSGTTFISGWSVAYFSSKAENGIYVLVLGLIFFWGGFRHIFCGIPLLVFLPKKKPEEGASYIGSTVVMQAVTDLASVSMFSLLMLMFSECYDNELYKKIIAAMTAYLGLSARQHFRQIFYSKLAIKTACLIDGVYCVINLSGIAAFFFMDAIDSVTVFFAAGLSQLLAAIVGFLILSFENSISFKNLNMSSVIPAHWNLGKWLALANILSAITAQFLLWILKYRGTLELVGIFGACVYPLRLLNPFLIGVGNLLVPKMSHALAKEGIRGLRRVNFKCFIFVGGVVGFVALLLILFSGPIIHILYKGRYDNNSDIMALMAVSLFFTGITMPLSNALKVLEHTWYELMMTLMTAFVTLTAGIVMVFYFDVAGVALNMILVQVVLFAGLYCYYHRAIKNRYDIIVVPEKNESMATQFWFIRLKRTCHVKRHDFEFEKFFVPTQCECPICMHRNVKHSVKKRLRKWYSRN